jgi:hypothetical protein
MMGRSEARSEARGPALPSISPRSPQHSRRPAAADTGDLAGSDNLKFSSGALLFAPIGFAFACQCEVIMAGGNAGNKLSARLIGRGLFSQQSQGFFNVDFVLYTGGGGREITNNFIGFIRPLVVIGTSYKSTIGMICL